MYLLWFVVTSWLAFVHSFCWLAPYTDEILDVDTSKKQYILSPCHEYLPQRVEDRLVSIHCDSCECDDTTIDTYYMDERTEAAHEVRQVPTMQQSRLEPWKQKKIKLSSEDSQQTFLEPHNLLTQLEKQYTYTDITL